ncbi:trigger factor [Natronoglycomyces albus]|uniref:Trigger factor n=1 Tax=Natronoglycomyces albus TaxID=2811108 RepID=A0A895XTC0_9ACTN|nr:trigger factor [Natronoglycomyces albus]QSB06535.1 trigger factor [Natronoglycomyces albus]
MKSTVETLSPTRVRLSVEVPFEELSPHIAEAYKQVGQQVRVPGFRPGKAPKAIIDQRVGRDAIYAQAIDGVMQTNVMQALQDEEITPLGRPEVTDMDKIEEGEPFTFTFETDVTPDFEMPEFSSLKAEVERKGVDEAAVDEDIEGVRLRFSSLKTVERAADNGDFVVIDLKATIDGEEVEGGSAEAMSHEVGAGGLVDGLDEALVGMSAGSSTTIKAPLAAGDKAGDDADIEITVQAVKERELPELDDEFAQMASEFDTIAELRESTRERLAKQSELSLAGAAREKVLDALLSAVDVPLPEKAVADEIEHRKKHLADQVSQFGSSFEDYLQMMGKSAEEFEAETKEEVENNLRQAIVLNRIAREKEVEVSNDQLTAEVMRIAQQQGVPQEQFPEFVQQLRQQGSLQQVGGDLRRRLALEEVVKEASIADDSGTALTSEELFPGRAEAEAAAEESEEADDK